MRLLALLAVHAAAAFGFPPSSAVLIHAEQIADRYWTVVPCSGQVSVVYGPIRDAQGQPLSINAYSQWDAPQPDSPPADFTNCSVTFNTLEDWSWPMFCTVTTHEFGHLTGHQHSLTATPGDPYDVMNPYYNGPFPACDSPKPLRHRRRRHRATART